MSDVGAFASSEATIAEVRQEAFLDRELFQDEQEEARWEWVRGRLQEWRAHPAHLVEEGIEPPREDLIDGLLQDIGRWRANQYPAPSYVSPNGEGGLVIGWRRDPILFEIEIDPDRTVERRKFVHSRLVEILRAPAGR